VKIIDGVSEDHGAALLAILNEAILNSTALYEYRPRTAESMTSWFRAKADGNYPVVVAIDERGGVSGFATYGPFRAFPAYKYTVEHSVYVHREQRRRGVGHALMKHLIARATEQHYHAMIGVVDGGNAGSVGLHERMGFVRSGVIREVGFKFGRWLDAVIYQLLLPTPFLPTDG
jgi:L-amino acid N-acyltransferase